MHYKVDIIHYLNPHLIWIEIVDPSPSVLKKGGLLEQIGLAGVLPQEKALTMSANNLEIKIHKCKEWMPAASAIIRHLIQRSDEVWFSPTHIERRSSILDTNIHKYGDLIFKTKDGQFKKLSKLLLKAGLAYYDECEFYKKLSSGQLKTKLNMSKTHDVIKQLEKCSKKDNADWKNSIEEQTSVFRMWQSFEQLLTQSSLEKQCNKTLHTTLINKAKDFELCKDVDEQSVGRACHKPKTIALDADTDKGVKKLQFLTKRLSLYKKINN